jgi:hypothetical protein
VGKKSSNALSLSSAFSAAAALLHCEIFTSPALWLITLLIKICSLSLSLSLFHSKSLQCCVEMNRPKECWLLAARCHTHGRKVCAGNKLEPALSLSVAAKAVKSAQNNV